MYRYYLPVFFWVRRQLAAHRAAGKKGPLVVGVSAPQGCGKSTLCEELVSLLAHAGAPAAAVSIDDFYLTHAEQAKLAARHGANPLLQSRGNAGSHDLRLGAATLRALKGAAAESSAVPLPRYDKSAFSGQGDRAPKEAWPVAAGALDVVLFEGWMLGFAPVGAPAAAAASPHLPPVDKFLESYKKEWDASVDAWLVVRVDDPGHAHAWRAEAEVAMAAAGRPAMTPAEVSTFVDRFMPAYRAYLPGLYKNGPTTAAPGKLLVVAVDEARAPVAEQPPPPM